MTFGISRAIVVRSAPFALFIVLLAIRGAAPADGSWGFDPRWLYAISVVVVGMLLWRWRAEFSELFSATLPSSREVLLSAGVGVAVFGLWISLDASWMRLGESSAGFQPVSTQGEMIWPLVVMRWVGAALLVPVMEELFWRSLIMRWIEAPQFEGVDPRRVGLHAVMLSTFVFMLAHTLWLAAIIAGLAYAWLYIRTGRLWSAVIAHAVTNGVLGVWVVLTGNWAYW
jgi:uncharacterized protein